MINSFKIFFLYFLTVVFLIFVLRFLFVYLTPFILAFIFASILYPIVNKLENYFNIKRGFAVFFVLSFFALLFILIISLAIIQIYYEVDSLWHKLPEYNNLIEEYEALLRDNATLQYIYNSNFTSRLRDFFGINLQMIYNIIKNTLALLAKELFKIISLFPVIILVMFLSFIATFFILRDIKQINDFFVGLFPDYFRFKIYKFEKEIVESIIAFFRAELILASITSLSIFFALLIIRNDYAFLLAFFSILLDLIPIIGSGIIFLPWIIFSFFTGDLILAMKLLIIYTIVTALRQGVESKIYAYQLGFHPLAIMISFYLSFKLLGIIGLLIGPAVLVFFRAIYNTGIFKENIIFKE